MDSLVNRPNTIHAQQARMQVSSLRQSAADVSPARITHTHTHVYRNTNTFDTLPLGVRLILVPCFKKFPGLDCTWVSTCDHYGLSCSAPSPDWSLPLILWPGASNWLRRRLASNYHTQRYWEGSTLTDLSHIQACSCPSSLLERLEPSTA